MAVDWKVRSTMDDAIVLAVPLISITSPVLKVLLVCSSRCSHSSKPNPVSGGGKILLESKVNEVEAEGKDLY